MPEDRLPQPPRQRAIIQRPFLTGDWRYLLMLNYEIKPEILEPWCPPGTELDLWEGKALVSMVGLRFTKIRLFGVLPMLFHSRFDQVNLRFYVRPKPSALDHDGQPVQRGVGFIKQIIPDPWIARVARWVYAEKFVALPVRHTIEMHKGKLRTEGLVEYSWRHQGRLNRLGGLSLGESQSVEPGSEAEFITERHWGYTRRGRKTLVYQVAHPEWCIWPVTQPYLLCDIKALYGGAFDPYLRQRPRSAFLAEGSPTAVFPPRVFRGERINPQTLSTEG